jgi:hypothetical protein
MLAEKLITWCPLAPVSACRRASGLWADERSEALKRAVELVGDRPAELIKLGKKLKSGAVKDDIAGALGCETPSQPA